MHKFTKQTLERFSEFFKIDFLKIPEKKFNKKLNSNSIDIIADVHIPFNKDNYENLIEDRGAGKLIIVGDFIDFISVSRFPKRSQSLPTPEYEFMKAFESLLLLSKRYNNIYIIMSNHDNRLDKYLYNNVSDKLIKFCYIGITEDLISLIPNVKVVSQHNGRKIPYVWQFKDIIFTHFEKSNIDIGKPVIEIDKFLNKWAYIYKLKHYNVIMQAHNHSSAYIRMGNKRLYQIPCFIDIDKTAFDYVFNGKPQGNPPIIGYIQTEISNNVMSYNRTRIIEL